LNVRDIRRRTVWLVLGFVGVLLLAACGSVVRSSPDVALSEVAVAGRAIPADFQITVYQGESVLDGDEVQFSELLRQGKPVVLNLWAGLCPPCRLEMPDLQAVSKEFSDEVVLFGLDVGPFTNLGTSEDGQRLIQELGVSYPVGTTADA
jgi:thiol-disulfide isomerase/thioredoxin